MADASEKSKVTQRAPTVITGLVVTGLPLINGKPPTKTLMKVKMGQQTTKTSDFVVASHWQPPSWTTNILVNDLGSQTPIRFSLYARKLFGKTLLAATEVPIDALVPSNKELLISLAVAPSQQSNALVVRYETNVQKFLGSRPVLTEGFEEVVKIASEFSFLDSILPFKEMFDRLAQVHSMANVAWSLLTLGLDMIETQYAKDKGIVGLYKAMSCTFEIANEKDVIREWDILESTFDAMIRQTIECQVFISGYASENYLHRLVKLDVAKKTAEFCQGFMDLEAQFRDKLNRGVAIVTLGTHEAVKIMGELFNLNLGVLLLTHLIERATVLTQLKPPCSQLRPPEKCLPGTRIEPISHIISWIVKMNGEIMFITGFPGTGKSTLMSSIADAARHMGSQSRMGAYIRFDPKLMNDASGVITSIAYRLACFDKRIAEAISVAVKKCLEFEEMTVQEQFKKLLQDPLQTIKELQEDGPIVVLIDALDECEASEARTELFRVLAGGFGATLPFMRLIVASRALPDITNIFNPQKKAHIYTYSLDSMAKNTENDIRLYFTERFRQLEDNKFDELCAQHNAIQELTKRACGLFIWAFTTYTFIKQYPSPRLLVILETVGPTEPEAALDAIYRTALRAALAGPGSNSDIKTDMRSILGAILVVENPPGLVPSAIDGLLFHGSVPKSQDILRKLACVIIAESSQYALRSIHTSFNDFLMDKQRSGDDWYIDIAQYNKKIAAFCIRALGTHFDQIAADSAATSSSTIDAITLSDTHSYACKFWIVHFCKLDPKDQDLDSHVRIFFQQHFLRWLQCMSKLKSSGAILPLMRMLLQHTNQESCSAADRALRYDAFQFAEQFRADIEKDPVSVFSTGLTFCSDDSSLRALYPCSRVTPTVTGTRCSRLLTWCTHKNTVSSAVFFPDGSKYVSASWDCTLRIWDAHTGAPISGVMKGHEDKVACTGVSPDGLKIVSGAFDSMIIIWDARSGQRLLGPLLAGHGKPVMAVNFSPDSSRIVIAGEDKIIQVWDTLTGLPVIEPILAHDEGINRVLFSPDGTRILSGGDDSTIRMWGTVTRASLFEPIRLDGIVLSVAFSPDGSKFVSGSADNLVQVWDSATGISILEPIRGHNSIVKSVSFSNDGTKIVSGSWDNTIRVWDSTTGDLLAQPMQGHNSVVFSVQFSPDDTKILSSAVDSTIRLWDVSTFQSITAKVTPPNVAFRLWDLATKQLLLSLESQHLITSVAFSPSGTTFISSGWDNAINVWDTAISSLPLPPLLVHTAVVRAVSYSPSGALIASGSLNAIIRLWDAYTGDPVNEPFCGHDGMVTTVSFSSDGSRIVSASFDHTIRVWDVATGKEQFDALWHDSVVNAAFFSPDDTTIASGSDDHTVRVWDASIGEALHSSLRAHTGPVTYVAWSPNGKMIASASQDGTVKLWDFTTREAIREFQVHGTNFCCVKFWPDGQKFLAASKDGIVRAWNVSNSEPVFEPIHAHTDTTCADVSPDSSRILTGSWDKSLRIWDATNGTLLSAPIEVHDPVTALCSNVEVMALGAADKTIHIWNASTMTMPYEPLTGHKAIVLSLSLDSKSTRLVSGSKDKSFIVWDIVKGELLYRVDAHTDMVTSVTFSPDCSKIATGAADNTIKLWDVSDGVLRATLTGHGDRVVSVAFSSNGLYLVSASWDHTIRVWDASTGAQIFATDSVKEPLDKVVFSADGQSLIYASVGGVINRWPFRASSLTTSSSLLTDDVKRMPLSQSEVFVKFPRGMRIMTTYMTNERFYAVIKVTNQLITVNLP